MSSGASSRTVSPQTCYYTLCLFRHSVDFVVPLRNIAFNLEWVSELPEVAWVSHRPASGKDDYDPL